MPDLATQPQDTGLGPLIGGMPAPLGPPPQLAAPPSLQLNVPLPGSSGASGPGSAPAPSAKSDAIPDYEQPFFGRIRGAESQGQNILYGPGNVPVPPGNVIPGAIGPTGQPTHAFSDYQFEPTTWNAAAAAARQQGRVLNHNVQADRDWAAHYTAATAFRQKTGKDFDTEAKKASETGDWSQIDAALQAQWPTLGRGGPRELLTGPGAVTYGMTAAFQQQQALDREHLATMHEEMATMQKQMSEVNPDSQEYRKLLRQQIDASQAIEARYLQMAQNPPTRTMPDLFSGFGSLALLVAAIGGRHSRQPATASLNAAAGALQGIEQNNQQQFEDNFKTWEASTQALNNALTAQNDVFRNIMENEHLDESQRMERLNEAFKLFDMSEASFALEHGMLDKAMQFPQTLASVQQQMDLTNAQIGHLKAQTDNLAAGGKRTPYLDYGHLNEQGLPTPFFMNQFGQSVTADNEPYTPSGNYAKIPSGQQPVDPQAVDATVKMIGQYKLPPLSGWALKSTFGQQVERGLNQQFPNYDSNQYWGERAATTTIGRRGATLMLASNAADQLVPIVRDFSQKVPRTNYPDINKILLAGRERTGDPEVVAFGQALNSLLYVYMRALNPSGIPRVADLERGTSILQTAWSQGQLDAALAQMHREIGAEKASLAVSGQEVGSLFGGEGALQSAPAQAYETPEQVRWGVDNGYLNKNQAKDILVNKFGFTTK